MLQALNLVLLQLKSECIEVIAIRLTSDYREERSLLENILHTIQMQTSLSY